MSDPTSLELIQERNWLSTELSYGEATPADTGLHNGCGYIRYERAGRRWHIRLCPAGLELPQSENGGLHPELRARITAAKAALGDFDGKRGEWLRGELHYDAVSFHDQADRLSYELRSLLHIIERNPA